jgi:hypothetical protein
MSDAAGTNAITKPVPDRHADQRLKGYERTVQHLLDDAYDAAHGDKPAAGGDMKLKLDRTKP